jgi:hypothetical protein
MFLLLIDVFFLFVSVLNQLHHISIYTHKISPLEELVGGDLPPSSSQKLTGMRMFILKFHSLSVVCDKIVLNSIMPLIVVKSIKLYLAVAYM